MKTETTIIPSTSLKTVNVHKIKCMTCLRRYFWRHVLNLESKALNLNFWYGAVAGAGLEAIVLGKDPEKAMIKEDKKRCADYEVTPNNEDEMRLQRLILASFIRDGAAGRPAVRKMRFRRSQKQIKVTLKDSGLLFCGTPDAEGEYMMRPMLFEIKTARQVTNAYIDSLSFDKQVYGYAYAKRLLKEKTLPECCYCILRKPQKKIKKNQTISKFVDELTKDFIKRPDFYYIFHTFKLGHLSVSETGADIERLACILKNLYESLRVDELLEPHNWPKQEDKCYEYKGCEFLQLCKHPKNWQLYLRFYKQRTMLYEEEKGELWRQK